MHCSLAGWHWHITAEGGTKARNMQGFLRVIQLRSDRLKERIVGPQKISGDKNIEILLLKGGSSEKIKKKNRVSEEQRYFLFQIFFWLFLVRIPQGEERVTQN